MSISVCVCVSVCMCVCARACVCACVFYLNRAKLHFISTFFLHTFRRLNNVFPQNLKIPMGIITFAFIAFYHYRWEKFDVSFSFFSSRKNPILWRFSIFPFSSLLYFILFINWYPNNIDIINATMYKSILNNILIIMMTNYLYAICNI